ncbi:MAG: hydroxysqualene dehydroxylase HpnE [Methylophaga sp.]|nr:hydroxysqualene dehydroxylase HpnE [Methylophaga sp.]
MRVIIVGGGWSGLAAAVDLSQHCDLQIFEAGSTLGGRARSVRWQNLDVDNGQHLMLGVYQQMLALMQQIGIDPEAVFSRQRMDLSIVDPLYKSLKISSLGILPAALNQAFHLCQSNGFKSVLAVRRMHKQLKKIHDLRDLTVADLLQFTRQPPRLIRQLWEPLSLAMLNTPVNEASAAVFANVLNTSLFAGDKATELLIPKQPLGDVLPAPTAAYLSRQGAQINFNNRIQSLLIDDNRITGVVDQNGEQHFADVVVLALPPSALSKLLPEQLNFKPPPEYPICTIYLQYAACIRAPRSMTGFSGTLTQWLFDRSFQRPGLMALVISGPGPHMQLSKAELVTTVSAELVSLLSGWPKSAEDTLVIREKRATFACTPNTQKTRPESQTAIENLWLAGDFVRHPFPATLETAISNGQHCAGQILQITNETCYNVRE